MDPYVVLHPIFLFFFFICNYDKIDPCLVEIFERGIQTWNKVQPYNQWLCRNFEISGKMQAKLYAVLVEYCVFLQFCIFQIIFYQFLKNFGNLLVIVQ